VLAAALDVPVSVAETPEGTGLGACLLGLHALGDLPDLDRAAALVAVGAPTAPDPQAAELYARLRPLVEKAALAVLDTVKELDRLAPPPLPSTEKAVGRATESRATESRASESRGGESRGDGGRVDAEAAGRKA
jgi:gluconokinase